ncbi:hypothetical protein [Ilumatobacter sp.]|uniref:hypothetical protein n=1 Tax=Ilumatobacter sp. TaxID=1967498 RepID=UPI003AF5F9E6
MEVDDAPTTPVGSPSADAVSARPAFLESVRSAATVGVGSLPHRDAGAAAEFTVETFDVLTLPSLPRRSPAEAPVAQALVGAPGVTLGQYGTVAIDLARLDPAAQVRTELWRDAFGGFRACLEVASERGHVGPVKWQFVGPISVGLTLVRAGASSDVAFPMAVRLVRSHLTSLVGAIADTLPGSPQLVVLDEPFLDDLMTHDFPIAPDEAIDLLSSAMAAVEAHATVGVHTCGDVDLATLIASGPKVLSLPARPSLVDFAGYVDRFLRDDGWIVWGAVPTEGPIGSTAGRTTRALQGLWRDLAERGCDPARLRRQSLLSPQCGLGGHSASVAERVCSTVTAVSRTVQAT